jgi:hypothetical protein
MNYKKGIAPIVILFIILGGLAVGGGTYYEVKKSKSKAEHVTPAQEATVTNTVATEKKVTTPRPSVGVTPKVKATPVVAKTPTPVPVANYTEATLKIYPGSGWPVTVSATAQVAGTLEPLTGMAVLHIVPETTNTSAFGLKVSGLPANTKLYIYTNGYRNEDIKTTSVNGELNFTQTGPMQYIIKDKQS